MHSKKALSVSVMRFKSAVAGGIFLLFLCPLAQPQSELAGPAQAAPASSQPTALEGIRWRLIELPGMSLPPPESRQTPHITLNAESHRVSGFNGCNRIVGGYELDGERLTFSAMAGTRMACLKGMDIEQHFTQILSRVGRWKIVESGLDLLDADGNLLAHFDVSPEKSHANP